MAEVPVEYVGNKPDTGQIENKWWRLPQDQKYRSLSPIVASIQQKQSYRRINNIRFARMYQNMDLLGLQGIASMTTMSAVQATHRVTVNVIRSMIDAAAAKIAQNRVKVLYLTEGGDWSMSRRAKLRTKFMNGQFHNMGLPWQMHRSFTDSGVFGTGMVKFYKEGKRVACERVIIDEIFVDDADGIYNDPKTLYHVKFIDRDTLCEMFPKHEEAIMRSDLGMNAEVKAVTVTDKIRVVEAWHLPSYKGAGDGRHSISIESCDFVDEKYTKDYFPFIKHQWGFKLTGFWGMGIAENSAGLQLEINKLLRTTQEAMHLMCVPRVWIENNSQVNSQHISNEVGSIGKYQGTPPTFTTVSAMPPEVYQHIWTLYGKAYEQEGISQLMASAQKPAGLNSAVSIRTYNDIGTERFSLVAQRYEQSYLDAAKIVSDMMDELSHKYDDLDIQLEAGKYAETIKWSDVKLEENEFILRAYPTNLLPSDPAGKLQAVVENMQAGLWDQDTAFRLLDYPDLEAATAVKTAPLDLIYEIIEKMTDDGIYTSPEPYMNLQQAKTVMQYNYLRAKLQNVPEENLELMRRFMDDCETLLTPPAPPMGLPGTSPDQLMDPMAAPQLAPRSDMMPYSTAGQAMI
jgi:hypothetical protein